MVLEKAIKKTVKYSQKYGCSLTWEEIGERLIGSEIYDLRYKNSAFKKRNENRYWKKKMEIARKFAEKYLHKINDILMVGITGSVASKYPKKNDDIDLMVITKSNSLWIVRLKIFWIFWRYHIPHRTNKDDICINLWLEDMKIPSAKQNLKNAIDLVLMKPILDKENTYNRFLVENDWVKKYVKTPYQRKIQNSKFKITIRRERNNVIKSMVNVILFGVQYAYMRRKIGNEYVNLKQAFFHLT